MHDQTDRRQADLYAAGADFIQRHNLHPNPEAYLAHGYVQLCLRAWPTASGAPLHLATQWATWTWLADDVFDLELRDAPPESIDRLVLALVRTVANGRRARPADHALVGALADLAAQTRATMPDYWWERYRRHLVEWIHAAHEKLTDFLRPSRTPTLREYLTLRPADGGMLLAAMWCELAEQCITPDWNTPLVQSLLEAFSTCGYLTNDLAATNGDTFTARDALARTSALPAEAAREAVQAQLHAEERRFWWLYCALRDRPGDALQPVPRDGLLEDTSRFALLLDRFVRALREWTAASSRYALAAPEATS